MKGEKIDKEERLTARPEGREMGWGEAPQQGETIIGKTKE